eukprot:CAMPEP_0175913768 /NCGR_PEP_ID=MMETSP0108-20121206/9440_1 /TAXON_ID=195067 ORGANISM="Goniomonas pacifica, Strain CCMP1869" /NCGR_SAMPLE_ID=MMETSP0108 /ASSEMBLY_ACC=CAM_ASM_000204 /LENGTH=95 /DNA_ID=CAMNT_0017236177 /DNA_START=361 /DNA_END=646 /DNA_ORIENTATION=+
MPGVRNGRRRGDRERRGEGVDEDKGGADAVLKVEMHTLEAAEVEEDGVLDGGEVGVEQEVRGDEEAALCDVSVLGGHGPHGLSLGRGRCGGRGNG